MNIARNLRRAPFDQRLFRLVTRVGYSGNFSETVSELEIELDTQDGMPARLPVTLPAL